MKEHKKLCRNSKKIDPFEAKKVRGVKCRIIDFFQAKNEKTPVKLYRLAKIVIVGSYESLKANSSDDTSKNFHRHDLKWGEGKYCFVFESQFLAGHGPKL